MPRLVKVKAYHYDIIDGEEKVAYVLKDASGRWHLMHYPSKALLETNFRRAEEVLSYYERIGTVSLF